MNQSLYKIINLNTDQSIPSQTRVFEQVDIVADLSPQIQNLRLWSDNLGLAYLRQQVKTLRQAHPEPWLTLLGSGDFHHYTLALLETLPQDRPITLVLIDNHPDWFYGSPTFHCGNWVSGVLNLPWVKSIILVGQDSADLKGYQFWSAPWKSLCDGRLKIYPYRRTQSFIPLKWPKKVSGVESIKSTLFGTTIQYATIESHGEERFFDVLADSLAGQSVYLSIDKDCLKMDAAITDWEQGRLSLPGLLHGIQRLHDKCQIVGADICGETAPEALSGFAKKLDAGRFTQSKTHTTSDANQRNEQTNLELLRVFAALSKTEESILCPLV